ncbi:NAD-dependent epimerase/dehydratase family protein [Acinetobacter chinensis]|uniref:NAD-dependent epimerase/dehydratase family protein n=1 Tax=Acinetobacter chinensis TaxID=2004650 RepID=A0ABU3WD06_9GAMM|nr:NAD-dependent epimerase/dehydratase family protein [Acinetobacter chinensis]MDV2468283.1 NAD-dependent epimerase/dehydratase family protein [Acinetobacter chinensis]
MNKHDNNKSSHTRPIIFVAGATGAVGFKLCLILKQHDYQVYGTTRSINKACFLEAIGVVPVIVDVFNKNHLINEIQTISPQIIIHQLTDLPYGLNPEHMQEARKRNAKIRETGTAHLIEAAQSISCQKFIAQSITFAHEPSASKINEDSPLAISSDNEIIKNNALNISDMESRIRQSQLNHVILRYAKLYGPATGCNKASEGSIHVDVAAHAAYLAINNGSGTYLIVEEDQTYSSEKAKNELNLDTFYRWKTQHI